MIYVCMYAYRYVNAINHTLGLLKVMFMFQWEICPLGKSIGTMSNCVGLSEANPSLELFLRRKSVYVCMCVCVIFLKE